MPPRDYECGTNQVRENWKYSYDIMLATAVYEGMDCSHVEAILGVVGYRVAYEALRALYDDYATTKIERRQAQKNFLCEVTERDETTKHMFEELVERYNHTYPDEEAIIMFEYATVKFVKRDAKKKSPKTIRSMKKFYNAAEEIRGEVRIELRWHNRGGMHYAAVQLTEERNPYIYDIDTKNEFTSLSTWFRSHGYSASKAYDEVEIHWQGSWRKLSGVYETIVK